MKLSMAIPFTVRLQKAADHLAEYDATLRPIITRAGLPTFRPHREYYRELGGSIISQQLSVKAAATIERRFCELFGGAFPEPAAIVQRTVDELRPAGLSRAKAIYIRDLAQHVLDGKVRFDKLDRQTNDEVIAALTDVKGIGEWTAHMFLIFCMGRLDVLPTGDLGIRNGIRKLYKLDQLPSPQQIVSLAQEHSWHPYESAASWYIWHSLDNVPAVGV